MKSLVLFVFVVFITSCTTVKKSVECLDNHKTDASKYCSERFPIKERTVTKTEFKEGKETIKEIAGETIYVDCDSAVRATLDEASRKHIAIKGTPIRTIITVVDTISIHDTVYSESTAKIDYLTAQLTTATREATDNKAWGKKWQHYAFIGLGFILLEAIFIGARFLIRK